MKRKYSMTISLVVVAMLSAMLSKSQTNSDSNTIQNILKDEVDSWNKGDAQVYSQHFSEHGTFTNIRGMFFTGHQQFLDRHIDIFKGMFAKTVLQQQIVSFRFLNPDVAIVETLTWINGFSKEGQPKGVHIDSKGRLHTRLLQVFKKESGNWKIVVYHNVDLKPDSPVPAHQ